MDQYKLYRNTADCFSFEIPDDCQEVAVAEHRIPTAAGEGKMKSYSTGNISKMFLLGITELGIELDTESQGAVMEYAKSRVVAESQLISSEKTTCSGFPALKIRISRKETKTDIFADIVFCIIRDKQYQLEVMAGSAAELVDKSVDRFFTSFTYIDPAKE